MAYRFYIMIWSDARKESAIAPKIGKKKNDGCQ